MTLKQKSDEVTNQTGENTNNNTAGASGNTSSQLAMDVCSAPSSDFGDFTHAQTTLGGSGAASDAGAPMHGDSLRNSHSPTNLSDLSSSPSLSDLQHTVSSGMTSALPVQQSRDANMTSSCAVASNFSDFFCQVTNSMNSYA